MSAREIRILIVDDHAVVREGLAAMFSRQQGMKVVGAAATGREALTMELELAPDVIIMDLVMPDMDGLETTIAIKQQNSNARILVLSTFNEEDRTAAIMEAGASGYLLKDAGAEELLQAVRSVYSGHLILSPVVMKAMSTHRHTKSNAAEAFELTPREQEVLQGIVDGLTNREIALRLGISNTTVRSHVSHVMTKLNVTNRTQAALAAQEFSLV